MFTFGGSNTSTDIVSWRLFQDLLQLDKEKNPSVSFSVLIYASGSFDQGGGGET